MNAEYMKKLTPEEFYEKALPWLQKAISNPTIDLRAVAALVQSRCEILSDLPERVDFLDRLPDYDTALYVHKKSKTTLENSLTSSRPSCLCWRPRRTGATMPSTRRWRTWQPGKASRTR